MPTERDHKSDESEQIIATMEKDFQEDALNSMALSEDKAKIHGFSETEKKESFCEKIFFKSIMRASRQESYHDREYALVHNFFGFLLGYLMYWLADVSRPEHCPSIGQFWLAVQGLFYMVFHAIDFLANVAGEKDMFITVEEVVCSLFGLYMWIGFITYFISWLVSIISTFSEVFSKT